MGSRIQGMLMSNHLESLSLAEKLMANYQAIDPTDEKDLEAAVRLALTLERDNAHRGGFIKQDIDSSSLHRVCSAVSSVLLDRYGVEPPYSKIVAWCIHLRCPAPEILIAGGRTWSKTKVTKLGRNLQAKLTDSLLKKLTTNLPDTALSIGPSDTVYIESGDPNDKIGQLDRIIERSGFFGHLDKAWQASGKSKEEFTIAIKPNIMMIFRLSDDGTYTDTILVLRLIERIIAEGFSNVCVVEAQNLYGNWYGNREVIKVAAHGGYLDREIFHTFKPDKEYFGYVLVHGNPRPFKIVDLTYDEVPFHFTEFDLGNHNLGKTWITADYRINFPKFKTHFFNFYTVLVKNTYGCLPAQDKIKHYHYRKITHQLTAAQLLHFPVHFSFVDAITGADGILGAKMKADSKKPGLILAGSSMLAIENVCAQMMGYDPYCNDFFVSAVKTSGDLRAVKIDGPVHVLSTWRKVPGFVDALSSFGEYFYHLSVHFGHIFTGHNDLCFPHHGRLIRLRRILAIFPYPILWLTNLDQIRVRLFRYRMRKFCKAHSNKFPLSATNKAFFDLIYQFSLKDISILGDFLEKIGTALFDENIEIKQYGHRARVGDFLIEFNGMKHFAAGSAIELFKGIRSGNFALDEVIKEIRGWQTIEVPSFLRAHLLIDSPYICQTAREKI